jgi:N-acetyltransferase
LRPTVRAEAFRHPVELEGHGIRLRRLTIDDAPALLHAARDPEVGRHLFHPPGSTLAEVEGYVRWILGLEQEGTVLPFVVSRTAGRGGVIGAARFLDIDRKNDAAEVGTWLDSAHWRTGANLATKSLLLTYAFETAGCHRVTLRTDLRNERSRTAIARLGAVREGILRDEQKLADGGYRSSVLYSILADEWPAVRARLEARMARARRTA